MSAAHRRIALLSGSAVVAEAPTTPGPLKVHDPHEFKGFLDAPFLWIDDDGEGTVAGAGTPLTLDKLRAAKRAIKAVPSISDWDGRLRRAALSQWLNQ